MVRGSWLVKACHYTRMGRGKISQRAAFQDGPYVYGRWPGSFCDRRPAAGVYFFIACMRFRRGRLLRRPASAVRFGNRLAPSAGRHLPGQKGRVNPVNERNL